MEVSSIWKTILRNISFAQALMVIGICLNIGMANADNPIVQTIYTADPAPLVYDGRVYLFTGHDEDGSSNYDMRDWQLFSSADMVNWQIHRSPMNLATFSWASANAWAGQVIERDGRFYYYVPMTHNTTGSMAIGVGVSNNITGPYIDAIGSPLVENGQIDPTVFIDDDGQAYLYWGNPDLWYVKLNEDMVSFNGEPIKMELTVAGFGERAGASDRTSFEEGPWVYKRNGIYYILYAANCCAEDIRYSTSSVSPVGPWTYGGIVMPSEGSSFTNHPGVIDFAGASYFFYHNGALPGGGGFTRSVAVESFVYNTDGSIPTFGMTTAGPEQINKVNPYERQEAETMAFSSGIKTEDCSEGGTNVAWINNDDYIKVKGVDFEAGAVSFSARIASASHGGNIELHLDGINGTLIGVCNVPTTGGWQSWTTVICPISSITGTRDLFFFFTGDSNDPLFNFDWWQFA